MFAAALAAKAALEVIFFCKNDVALGCFVKIFG
jgi:hypothetical protein